MCAHNSIQIVKK